MQNNGNGQLVFRASALKLLMTPPLKFGLRLISILDKRLTNLVAVKKF